MWCELLNAYVEDKKLHWHNYANIWASNVSEYLLKPSLNLTSVPDHNVRQDHYVREPMWAHYVRSIISAVSLRPAHYVRGPITSGPLYPRVHYVRPITGSLRLRLAFSQGACGNARKRTGVRY